MSLTGVLGTLVALNPYTTIVSAVLYILTAIATVEATKTKYQFNLSPDTRWIDNTLIRHHCITVIKGEHVRLVYFYFKL